LDSKNKDKPVLSDCELIQQWSLPQFKINHTRFLANCPVRKGIMDEKHTTEKEQEMFLQDIWDEIEQLREEEQENDALELNRVSVQYQVDSSENTALFNETISKLMLNNMEATSTEMTNSFILSLVRNQHHLLCCIDDDNKQCKNEDKKCQAAAIIEPYHVHHCVWQETSTSSNVRRTKDCSVILVHEFYYDTALSFLHLLHVIHDEYMDLKFDFLMFDISMYTGQHSTDSSKLVLNSKGREVIQIVPPYKEMQIDNSFYIGITKLQLADIHASDGQYIHQRIVSQIWDFWAPANDMLRFMKVTKKKPVPRVTYHIPYFGAIHLTGEKRNIKALVKNVLE
jgi:hypothetical protein